MHYALLSSADFWISLSLSQLLFAPKGPPHDSASVEIRASTNSDGEDTLLLICSFTFVQNTTSSPAISPLTLLYCVISSYINPSILQLRLLLHASPANEASATIAFVTIISLKLVDTNIIHISDLALSYLLDNLIIIDVLIINLVHYELISATIFVCCSNSG